ncbi:MAG TPA: SDR family oxidoreductase [Vicinamibacterales bacterium]|nr:SDR family oxidoreductase [Vicinamibacterales bacterium]
MTSPSSDGGRTALVTGASSGIGEAFARVFAEHGWDLVLTARREDRLARLAGELAGAHRIRVEVVPADLSDPSAPSRLVDEVARRGVRIDGLVNNAGYGVPGRLLASPWHVHEAFLRVMVTAVVELTHRLLPAMLARKYGRIVNVASLAGLVPPTAGHTLYSASKAFVIRFSQALAAEVAADGVHVTALCPGFTLSEFHDVTGTRERVKRLPRWMWMDARTVAEQGYRAVMAGDVVHVTGRVNRTIAALTKVLPERLVLAVSRRNASKFREV